MFSIVIPIYNVQDYLRECVESVLKQISEQDEILLVDDGSKDTSAEIAIGYADKYPQNIRYFKKENGGLSDARNYGAARAKKEYLFFVDSDDYLAESTLDTLRKIAQETNPDLIVFDYIIKWDDREKFVRTSEKNGLLDAKEYLLMNPCAWNKVIKTQIFKENHIQFPKGLWYEDRATTGSYVNYCTTMYHCCEAFYYYRQRDNSIMNQKGYNPKMMDIVEAMRLFDVSVDEDSYKQEKEYLFISNLLFQNALRLLPPGRYKEMKQSYRTLKNRYPQWKNNPLFLKESKGYRLICCLMGFGCYRISRLIINARLRRE